MKMITGNDLERAFEIEEDLQELREDVQVYNAGRDTRSRKDALEMIKALEDEKRAMFGEPVAEGDTSNQGIHA